MGNVGDNDVDTERRARDLLIKSAEMAAELAVSRLSSSALPDVAEVTALMNASANALTASLVATREGD